MPAVFYYPHRVTADDIDELGHANNLAYLRWSQRAAVGHSTVQGWPVARYRELGRGWIIRAQSIVYRQPALPGHTVIVKTWVAELHKATSLRKYEILLLAGHRPLVLATGEIDWAFVHYASGMPHRIPPEVAAAFEIVSPAPDTNLEACHVALHSVSATT